MRDAALFIADKWSLAGKAIGSYLSPSSVPLGTADSPPDAFQAIGSIPKDLGRGTPLVFYLRVDETFASPGGLVTLQVAFVQADAADLVSGVATIFRTRAYAVADLVQGAFINPGIPAGVTKAFVGAMAVIAGEAPTAGTISIGIDRPPNVRRSAA